MPKPKSMKAAAAKSTARNDQATMVVTLYDGTREAIQGKDFLIRIFDGFQNQLFDKERTAPTTVFRLPYRDNLQDNCTVLASGDGYVDAGFTPVKLSLKAVAMVDLMLLEDKADFKFQTWDALKTSDAVISDFISVGSTDVGAKAHYDNLRQTKPAALASLLNLATAMKTIQLPNKTPLDYFEEILWDESLAQDRFFGYADKSIVDQVRRAAMEGEFAPEPSPGLFHPDATSSFKQIHHHRCLADDRRRQPFACAHKCFFTDCTAVLACICHFLLGTNGLTGTGVLDNFFKVALRRIPITPDLDPNFVVGHDKLLYEKSCP